MANAYIGHPGRPLIEHPKQPMSEAPDLTQALRIKVRGTNICEETLLATDYLNHLNEPIMLFEMLADVPDLLDELSSWSPKTYIEHFQHSGFAEKDLAIEAYAWSPERYRLPFEQTVDKANRVIATALASLQQLADEERSGEMGEVATETAKLLAELVDKTGAIIHGEGSAMGQDQIDQIMDD